MQCPKCHKEFRCNAGALRTHIRFCDDDPVKRFWTYVRKESNCWIWTGTKQRGGYGHFRIKGKDYTAHRYAYQLANGPIPPKMEIMHTCDVRACVNPAHLRCATHHENMLDAMAKDRHARGERNRMNKLTDEQAREILSLKGTTSAPKLCGRYGVGPAAINAIWRGDYWKHIRRSA